jgi:cytochrome c
MPPGAPGTLTADEIYGVVAWLLTQNGVIADNAVMSAETLPRVIMPARKRFVPDDRTGGSEVK